MLRLFCNINPSAGRASGRLVSSSNSSSAAFCQKARNLTPRGSRLLHLLGITRGRQT